MGRPPLTNLSSMSGQARIEALKAPLGAAPAAVPLMRVFVRELAEGQEVAGAFAVRERDRRTRKNGEDFIRSWWPIAPGPSRRLPGRASRSAGIAPRPGRSSSSRGASRSIPSTGRRSRSSRSGGRPMASTSRTARGGTAGRGRAAGGRSSRAPGHDPEPDAHRCSTVSSAPTPSSTGAGSRLRRSTTHQAYRARWTTRSHRPR